MSLAILRGMYDSDIRYENTRDKYIGSLAQIAFDTFFINIIFSRYRSMYDIFFFSFSLILFLQFLKFVRDFNFNNIFLILKQLFRIIRIVKHFPSFRTRLFKTFIHKFVKFVSFKAYRISLSMHIENYIPWFYILFCNIRVHITSVKPFMFF